MTKMDGLICEGPFIECVRWRYDE